MFLQAVANRRRSVKTAQDLAKTKPWEYSSSAGTKPVEAA